jgi:hypothetical protein
MQEDTMTYDEAKTQPLPDWPEWMSPEVAARYLDSSTHTLNDWRCKGKGPAFKRVGQRMVRYRKADLDTFMEAQG